LSENVPVRKGSEEYLDSEKYQVKVRDWSAAGNLDRDIALLNRLRRCEPALQSMTNLSFHESGHPEVLLYLKGAWRRDLLCAVSLDPHRPVEAELAVPIERLGISEDVNYEVEDLLTGERLRWEGDRQTVRFDPADRAGYIWRLVRGGGGEG
jgi:starch synthase (maltosyl-transferring)